MMFAICLIGPFDQVEIILTEKLVVNLHASLS